ncbi:MAG: hypothetical protein LC798_18245 [Chloroflexi bacterium]|nr:hypothetical protein [Chloroflexota bacterium]
MTHHDDEGPLDKIKDALDMDNDKEDRAATHDALDSDRSSGWAGVDEALGEDVENRPAGPDYGAGDVNSTSGRGVLDPTLDTDTDSTTARTREENV